MNITCNHCNSRLNIPDQKIPQDRETVFKCPKCKGKIDFKPADTKNIKASAFHMDDSLEQTTVLYDDTKTAMICMDDPELKKSAYAALKQMGYLVQAAKNSKAALGKMQYHVFNVIVIDDTFDNTAGLNMMLANINRMDMTQRRRICLILVSRAFKTNDNMTTLQLSANQIVNAGDMKEFDKIVSKAVIDHQNLYSVFNDALALNRQN